MHPSESLRLSAETRNSDQLRPLVESGWNISTQCPNQALKGMYRGTQVLLLEFPAVVLIPCRGWLSGWHSNDTAMLVMVKTHIPLSAPLGLSLTSP